MFIIGGGARPFAKRFKHDNCLEAIAHKRYRFSRDQFYSETEQRTKMTLLDTPDMLFSIIESTQKPILAAGLTAGSLILTLLYLFTLDVKHSFIDPPKHFPKWRWSEMFFKPKINAPLVKLKPGSKDYEEVLERGSRQYPDRPFRIQHHPYEWVIVPYKMIDEVILRVPEAKLSFQQGSYDFFASQHTGITNHEKAVAVMLRTGINHIIDTVQGVVEDEASRTVRENIGECSDWTTIQMLPKTINMIMTISQRVFVGEPLCRDPKWVSSCRQLKTLASVVLISSRSIAFTKLRNLHLLVFTTCGCTTISQDLLLPGVMLVYVLSASTERKQRRKNIIF